jgi:two-component system, cell cycle sensor histidine kinase and response regulator CckA
MTSPRGKNTILIVDDTPDSLELMAFQLRNAGYEVLTATNGEEGFEITRQERPNLVISDVTMPYLDGIEMSRLIRADAELFTIPVLLVSAIRKDTKSIIDGLQSGAFDYLEAPYELKHLLAKTERLLEVNHGAIALRESEERYRLLVEQASDGILIFDKHGNFIEANRRACEMFGCDKGDLVQRNIREFIPAEELATRPLRMEELLAGKTVLSERYVRRKDGTRVLIEISAKMFEDGRMQAIIRDITERRHAEEARAQLATIVESTDDAIIGESLDGTITSWNKGAEIMYGYTAQEIVGRSISVLVPPDRRQEVIELLERVRNGKSIRHYETVRICKDGHPIDVSITVSPIKDDDGKVTGAAIIASDITERKYAEQALQKSEERYREIVENANDIIYTHDLAGRFLSLNKAGEQISGYSRSEILNMNIADIVSPEHIEKARRMIANKLNGNEMTAYNLEIIAKDGRKVLLEIHSRPIYENGVIACIQGIARDMTERKRAADALRHTEEQLRQSQKLEAIGRLAGGIAHDFNNLLTIITGYSDLVLRRLDQVDPHREKILEVKKAAHRAADLTHQLLAFSRKQVLQPKVIDINLITSNLSKMLERLIGEDIELSLNLKPGTWHIFADPGQIEQVLMNLVVNARDAMPQGGKIIIETQNVRIDERYAEVREVVKPGQYIMLAVSDTGMGMSAETQRHIFEPFFTTKEVGKGTGLGLSTVYGIIKQSGGYIWVYSEIDKGTTFKIYLPRTSADVETLKQADKQSETSHGTETILLAEDEAGVRALACNILEEQGYQVLEAADGEEAISVGKQHDGQIHLLLTDVVMPKMNVQELVDQIKSFSPQTKVLYMSGYTNDAIVHHGVLDPDTNFLEKPFTADGLLERVREILDRGK